MPWSRTPAGPRLGVAVPVMEAGQVLSLVYIRKPLAPFTEVAATAAPAGAYLAVRQGNYNVVESGTTEELKFRAEEGALPIEGTPMRVVAVAPVVPAGMFGLHGLGELGIAALLVLLAGVAFWLSRRPAGVVVEADEKSTTDPGELTLAEMQSAGKIVAPEVVKVDQDHAGTIGDAGHRAEPQHFPRLRHPRHRWPDAGRQHRAPARPGDRLGDAGTGPAQHRGRPRRPPVVADAWPAR